MRDLGKGLAVVGIWGAVAVSAIHDPTAGTVVALFAMFATISIYSQ